MNIPQTICPGCFGTKAPAPVCNLCSYDESQRRSPLVLPHRTVLQEQYVVGRVLGKPGGFGITYLAFDIKLRIKVALKEFLPRDLAGREPSQSTVYPHSQEDADIFAKGLQDFLKEAQNLAQFDHANIVRVRNFFQENSTAYIVMDYYDGITLMEYLQRQGGRMEWQMAVKIMTPIMDALREVHAKGFLHRDVKPQNIYLTRENRIILLDFGAARQAMGERTRSLTQIMTPGFAPFEQYHRQGRQGPWTDVYGVAATLYFMITGETPPEATERMQQDSLRLPSQVIQGVPVQLDKALLKGLAVKAEERFGSIQHFQTVILDKSVIIPLSPKNIQPVQAVRGYAPSANAQLFKDTKTGLYWPVNGNVASKLMIWDEARRWVSVLDYAGYSDWRLPTKDELAAFVKTRGKRPSELLNANGFINVQASGYWTSSKYPELEGYCHIVHLSDGYLGEDNISSYNFVWPVRLG